MGDEIMANWGYGKPMTVAKLAKKLARIAKVDPNRPVYLAQQHIGIKLPNGHHATDYTYYNIKHVDTLADGEPTIIWPCRFMISG
jgi:hypothetical protein